MSGFKDMLGAIVKMGGRAEAAAEPMSPVVCEYIISSGTLSKTNPDNTKFEAGAPKEYIQTMQRSFSSKFNNAAQHKQLGVDFIRADSFDVLSTHKSEHFDRPLSIEMFNEALHRIIKEQYPKFSTKVHNQIYNALQPVFDHLSQGIAASVQNIIRRNFSIKPKSIGADHIQDLSPSIAPSVLEKDVYVAKYAVNGTEISLEQKAGLFVIYDIESKDELNDWKNGATHVNFLITTSINLANLKIEINGEDISITEINGGAIVQALRLIFNPELVDFSVKTEEMRSLIANELGDINEALNALRFFTDNNKEFMIPKLAQMIINASDKDMNQHYKKILASTIKGETIADKFLTSEAGQNALVKILLVTNKLSAHSNSFKSILDCFSNDENKKIFVSKVFPKMIKAAKGEFRGIKDILNMEINGENIATILFRGSEGMKALKQIQLHNVTALADIKISFVGENDERASVTVHLGSILSCPAPMLVKKHKSEFDNTFFYNVAMNDVEAVRVTLESGTEQNQFNRFKTETVLTEAARNRNFAMFNLLLNHAKEKNIGLLRETPAGGGTALNYLCAKLDSVEEYERREVIASIEGFVDAVRTKVKQSDCHQYTNVADEEGLTPMQRIAMNADIDVLKVLENKICNFSRVGQALGAKILASNFLEIFGIKTKDDVTKILKEVPEGEKGNAFVRMFCTIANKQLKPNDQFNDPAIYYKRSPPLLSPS